MKVHEMPRKGAYEVRTDTEKVLGWIDLEHSIDPQTGTMGSAWVAKPVEGCVRARGSLSEAAAYVAGCFN